jgi:hypothetical protein
MRQTKATFTAGLAILLGLVIFGGSTESTAQSAQTMDSSQQKITDRIQTAGFITSKPLPSLGTIIATKNPVVNLIKGEIVYVRMEPGKEVKPGDQFTVVQQMEDIEHPITKEKIGHLVLIPGKVVVLNRKDQIVTAKIQESNRPILVGDDIITALPASSEAIPIRNIKKIEGRVILPQENIENITFNEFIFIDRGSRDGVIAGALFKIYQKGQEIEAALEKDKIQVPLEKIGEAVVVSAQEETSTALIILSDQEIHIGDQAVSGLQ